MTENQILKLKVSWAILFLLFIGTAHSQIGLPDSTYIKNKIDSLRSVPMSAQVDDAFRVLADQSQRINFVEGEARANIHMGNYLFESGQFADALARYQFVAKIGATHGDTNLIAKGYSSMGIVYSELNEFDKALKHFSDGMSMAEIVGDEKLFYSAVGGSGIVYAKMKKYEEAIEYLKKNKAGMTRLKQFGWVNVANYNIANVYLEENKPKMALPFVNEYLTTAKTGKDSFDICYAYKILGETQSAMNNSKLALDYLDSALVLTEKLNLNRLIPEIYEEQSEIYEKKGDLKNALAAHRQFAESKETMLNDQSKEQVAQLEVQFETEKKEKEIILKEKEVAEIKQSSALRQRRMWAIVAGLIALLFVAFVFFQKAKNDARVKEVNAKLMQSELKLKELKTKQLQSQLQNKNADLTNLALEISRKQEFSNQLLDRLENLRKEKPEVIKNQLRELILFTNSNLQNNEELTLLQENIDTVNQEFYQKLDELINGLSANDKYLAGLVRLNLSNKEVAALKGISTGSAKMGRHRLRKKLNLESDVDIVGFLQKL